VSIRYAAGANHGVEADPRLVSKDATRSGPSTAGSWRSMLGRRQADTTATPSTTTLPQGDLGTVDGNDRHHCHARVGQDLSGLVGLERYCMQGRGEGVAVMPQPPGWVELEAARYCLESMANTPPWPPRSRPEAADQRRGRWAHSRPSPRVIGTYARRLHVGARAGAQAGTTGARERTPSRACRCGSTGGTGSPARRARRRNRASARRPTGPGSRQHARGPRPPPPGRRPSASRPGHGR
jgi:hypothetical protein